MVSSRSESCQARPWSRRGRRAAQAFGDVSAGISGEHAVEGAVLGAAAERRDLGARVDQRRAGRIPGIADRDDAVRQLGYLDAVTAGVAVMALPPDRPVQPDGLHAVACGVHAYSLPQSAQVSRLRVTLGAHGRGAVAAALLMKCAVVPGRPHIYGW